MFSKILGWIKAYGARQIIEQFDELEEPIALKITEAQKTIGQISPREFARLLIDDFQVWACKKTNIDSEWVNRGK